MKKSLGVLFAFVLSAAAISGCKKDLGNYDYKDINTLKISADMTGSDASVFMTPDSISVATDNNLKIKLKVDQTNSEAESLEYTWMLTQYSFNTANPSSYVLGTAAVLDTKVKLVPNLYRLVAKVTDKTTGVSSYKNFVLNVTGQWGEEGWLVLQEQADGSDLSVITSRDGVNGKVYNSVYSIANGRKLPIGTYKVNVIDHQDASKAQKISFLYPNGGIQVRNYNFTDSVEAHNWFAINPGAMDIQSNGGAGSSGVGYEYLINNGQISTRRVAGVDLKTPGPIYFSPPFLGNYTLSPFVIAPNISGSDNYVTLYDKAYRCFLVMNLASNGALQPTNKLDVNQPNHHCGEYPTTTGTPNYVDALKPTGAGFDMNNMNADLIAVENAQVKTLATANYNCFFRNAAGTFMVQFPFKTAGGYSTNNATTGRFNFTEANCQGINSATIFAVPTQITLPGGKFYYVNGNKIFTCTLKVSNGTTIPQGSSTAAAQETYAEGTIIKAMKVFNSGYLPANLGSIPEGKVLVVATDETASGGGNKVYFYKIDASGSIVKDAQSPIVYTGFDKITDIVFKKATGK